MNMALDDALLQSVADGRSQPVLRLYRWQPAALSIGYAQSLAAGINLTGCRSAGIDLVRRPTGGRAVLHDDEITYAVMAPVAAPFGTTVAASYRVIAGVLREMLNRCGLPAELVAGQPRGEQRRAVCFTAPAQYELMIDNCKVAGCAQKRRGGAFLQHGSLPLTLDLALLRKLMPGGAGEEEAVRFRNIGWLQRFSPRPLGRDNLENLLVDSFADLLSLRFQESAPTTDELQLSAHLCAEFYGNPSWTQHGPGRSRDAGITLGN
jgi:lipoate-protein ligase A